MNEYDLPFFEDYCLVGRDVAYFWGGGVLTSEWSHHIPTKLHGIISKRTIIFIAIAMKTRSLVLPFIIYKIAS
jgi:hypothetical protein